MAAFVPITEAVIGTKDGLNTIFETSATYVPHTLFVYRNGALQLESFAVELGGKRFQVIDPPDDYEDIYVRYLSRV